MEINPDCFEFKWQGRLRYNGEDKVWGWFLYNENPSVRQSKLYFNDRKKYCNVFWGRPKNKILVNRIRYSAWHQQNMETKKIARNYSKITVNELTSLWPNFYEQLTERYIFALMTTIMDEL